jgi:oligoendopeptidase F
VSKLKDRSEIENQYKWDLESMYSSIDKWEEDFLKAESLIGKIKEYKGKIMDSPESLLSVINVNLELDRTLENVFTFSKMKLDENTKISKYQGMTAKSQSLGVKAGEAVSYIVPEMLKAEDGVFKDYMEKNEDLKFYEQHLDDILRRQPYTLSEREEELLAMAGDLASTPGTVFEMLDSADLKFPVVKDSNGKEIALSHGNFVPTLMSKDRELRKNTFKAFYGVYDDHINSMASLIYAEVKKNVFFAKARGYASAREASLFENNVPVSVYDKLIEAVNDNLHHMHNYMKLRKKALGLEELHMYDIYTPIIKDFDMEIKYEEAKSTVFDSLSILGEGYTEIVKKAYNDGWIDVYENIGKRSGAYSWGTYDSKPYILLNHTDNLDSVFTLTHEMGHSMHSYNSKTNQEYAYSHYSIFLAEVASTTNEALLNHHLLENVKNPEEKKYLINHYLEQFRGTVYRQTMFAEFERDIHEIVEGGGALTAEILSENYMKLNEKYYGPDMIIDDEIKLEWARIPHFYYNFYVFQYATGFSAAVALSQNMLSNGQKAVGDYLGFLGAGCSKYPIDILKEAGADMTSSEPVANCLKLFGEMVGEMEKLI